MGRSFSELKKCFIRHQLLCSGGDKYAAFKDSGCRDVCHAIKALIVKSFPYRFPKSSILLQATITESTQSCSYPLETALKQRQHSPNK